MNVESIKRDVSKLNYKIVDEKVDLIERKFRMVFNQEPSEVIMIDNEKGYINVFDDIFILCDTSLAYVEFSVHNAKSGYDPKYRIVKDYDDLILAIQNKMNEKTTAIEMPKSLNKIVDEIVEYLEAEPESYNPYGDFDEEEHGYLKGSFKMWHQKTDEEHDREAIYWEFQTRNGNRYAMGKVVGLGGYTIDREICAKLEKLSLKEYNQLKE